LVDFWSIFGPNEGEGRLGYAREGCLGCFMRETARSAHVWDKSWETALAVLQGGSEEMAENRMAQGMPPGALRSGFWLQICLGARGCV